VLSTIPTQHLPRSRAADFAAGGQDFLLVGRDADAARKIAAAPSRWATRSA